MIKDKNPKMRIHIIAINGKNGFISCWTNVVTSTLHCLHETLQGATSNFVS